MEIDDFVLPEAVLTDIKATSKKQALEELSRRAAKLTGLHERAIFDVLLERERLGTTGVGRRVAIPHGKIADLEKLHGIFAVLEKPIDVESVDGEPVDLVFLLLAPENAGADHLKALARVSRLLRDQGRCERLRAASSSEKIYSLLTDAPATNAA